MCTLSSVVGWCDQVGDYGTHDTPVIMVMNHALLIYIPINSQERCAVAAPNSFVFVCVCVH
jgi:hypothetical protein